MRWEDDEVRMTSQGVRTWVYVSTPPLGPSLQAEGPHYLTLHGTGAVDKVHRPRVTLGRQAQLADGAIRCQAG